jgi:2-amino-4-hydroxy-6-hydroxymethyldihydropteridine diphosphokinase
MIGKVLRTSYLYETMPMYHTEQSRFLNAVCLIETNLLPMELLVELQSIEQNVGRTQTFRNGPRLIDLDIVLMTNSDGTCDDIVQITNETLTVPHFRMTERSFVLMPLCDIDENLIHPVLKLSMRDLLAALPDESFADMTRVIPCRNHLTRVTQFIRIPIKKVAENNVDVKPNQGFMPLIVGVLNVTPDR